ncbi:MAG: FAD-dependent oxidoreductase [Acidobacteria bacterium]|nr:FAD-dependent oxidoreductase [Acidobacteriota bacterium]
MLRMIVVGGGWAGCAAALAARKAGAEAILVERADTLLGSGQVGGIMRNNGRFTATEEMIAMGAGELFHLADKNARHANIEFPGHRHASLYDVSHMEPMVRTYLQEQGVEIWVVARVNKAHLGDGAIRAVELTSGPIIEGDVFVDTTGSMGPMGNCSRYGNGCAMCITRCPSFGGRVSLAKCAGVEEYKGVRPDGGVGAMSGSCKLNKDSLAPAVRRELDNKGVVIIPVPKAMALAKENLLDLKCCQQYALKEFAENVVILDTGHAKLMAPFYPLMELRKIPGLQDARYEDPYAGGLGNSIRFLAMSPREDTLRIKGVRNLFGAGEKVGPLVGHTEAICTGTLAGHNAVRLALGLPLVTYPLETAVGEFVAFSGREVEKPEGRVKKFTFSGALFFERMRALDLYTTDVAVIRQRVQRVGWHHFFTPPLA